jgi:Zn-dependent protease/CBS domain-containing protein
MQMSGFKIGSIAGIPIRVHFTFLLVLPLLAFAFARVFREAASFAQVPAEQLRGSPFAWGLGLSLALFVSVLLHELAHSLYALRKGGRVRDITLLMIGGVSQISELPREAKHEAVMALVGPLASIALGLLLYAVQFAIADTSSFQLRFGLFYLGGLNLFLGFFNLLPAFPMDGGRILRSLLRKRFGMLRATRIAATVGKLFAVAFGLWGFVTLNMLLLLIAFFVYAGAESESRSVQVKTLIGRLRVRDLMAPQVFSVPGEISVHEAVERMLREKRLSYAATSEGRVFGLITLENVQKVPPERRGRVRAREIASSAPTLSPEDEVSTALQIMNDSDVPELAVAHGGRVIGSIGRDDIARGLKLEELESTQRWSGPPEQPPVAAVPPPSPEAEESSSSRPMSASYHPGMSSPNNGQGRPPMRR